MTKLAFVYITGKYLKNFSILLIGLSLAVVMIDFLQHINTLTGGVNRKILYLFYRWESMLTLVYPLVIVFALIMTQMAMIAENTLVALFSFGYSRSELFRPFLLSSVAIYLFFLALQCTPFSYSKERADAILHEKSEEMQIERLFFKYNDDFVYVEKLDPVRKILYNAMIFVVRDGKVEKIVSFPKAKFRENEWIASDVETRSKIFENGKLSGFTTSKKEKMSILEGYKPKVVKLIYEGHSLTLPDAVNALLLLQEQKLDTNKIKSILYNKVLMPLSAIALLVIFFFKIPPYQRFIRRELVWAATLGVTLSLWGVLHALFWLGSSGVLSPDFAQPPLVLFLLLYAVYVRFRETRGMLTSA